MANQNMLEIVQKHNMPEFLAKYITPNVQEDSRNLDDMGPLDPSDFGIGFVKLVTSSSRENTPGWGPVGNENPLPVSTIFTSREHKVIPVGSKFVPLLRSVRYIRWIGRPGDGRMEFQTHDPRDPRIAKIDGLAFRNDPNSGRTLPPLVTKYINFYVMTQVSDEPLVLSFYRTSEPVGKRFTQDLWRATKGYKAPIRCLQFIFEQPRIVRDGANSWPQFKFCPAGFVTEEIMKKADLLHETAMALDKAAQGSEFGSLDEPGEEAQIARKAEGDVVGEKPGRKISPAEEAGLIDPDPIAGPPEPSMEGVQDQAMPTLQNEETSTLW